MKKNVYTHEIDLDNLSIKNCSNDLFKAKLEQIKYRGYKVEDISDGRKIVITKPGGKNIWGRIKIEDFMVWIFNPKDNSLWRISHQEIYEDLVNKSQISSKEALKIIEALEKVYNGIEPDEIKEKFTNPGGIEPEVLLKAYKWIWGQEDVNYPNKLGRKMSFEGLVVQDGKISKTGKGILDLKNKLLKNNS